VLGALMDAGSSTTGLLSTSLDSATLQVSNVGRSGPAVLSESKNGAGVVGISDNGLYGVTGSIAVLGSKLSDKVL